MTHLFALSLWPVWFPSLLQRKPIVESDANLFWDVTEIPWSLFADQSHYSMLWTRGWKFGTWKSECFSILNSRFSNFFLPNQMSLPSSSSFTVWISSKKKSRHRVKQKLVFEEPLISIFFLSSQSGTPSDPTLSFLPLPPFSHLPLSSLP